MYKYVYNLYDRKSSSVLWIIHVGQKFSSFSPWKLWQICIHVHICICMYYILMYTLYKHLHVERKRNRKLDHCQQVQVRWASSGKFDAQGTHIGFV